ECELAGFESGRGYGAGIGQSRREPLALIVAKPEGLVLDDRAASRSAEIVPDIWILPGHLTRHRIDLVIEEVPATSSRVPTKPISVAPNIIGTALGNDVHDSATVAAILGRKAISDQPEFLCGLGRDRAETAWVARDFCVVVIHPIEHEVIVLFALA